MIRIFLIAALALSAGASAQQPAADAPPPPPLVDAPPVKESDAPRKEEPPTPPPPGAHLPNGNQSGYPYSPYGAPAQQPQELPVEYGLIATEYLFGVLTAAPIVLLPYILFLKGNVTQPGSQAAALNNILFLVIFATIPVAVAQTEVGLANGSRYYTVESWPAYLSGFLAQAMVIGLYYLAGVTSGLAETLLLAGSILFVPAVETAAINYLKTPKPGFAPQAVFTRAPGGGWSLGPPRVMPLFTRLTEGVRVGLSVPIAAGTF